MSNIKTDIKPDVFLLISFLDTITENNVSRNDLKALSTALFIRFSDGDFDPRKGFKIDQTAVAKRLNQAQSNINRSFKRLDESGVLVKQKNNATGQVLYYLNHYANIKNDIAFNGDD